jgi:hypothetical protein
LGSGSGPAEKSRWRRIATTSVKLVFMRAIALFLLIACSSFGSTQGNLMGVNGRFSIVMMPEAKKELKITKDQDKKMQEAVKELQASTQGGTLPPGFDMMNPTTEARRDSGRDAEEAAG